MSIDQASPLVPIKPQLTLQNSAFIKNSHNRSSFCGVTPSPTSGNGTFKTFAVNRKSWSGNVTLPLQQFNTPQAEQPPQLATFRSGTGTFPRNRERNNNSNSVPNGILTPNGNSVQTFKGNEVRRNGCANGRRYAEIGNWSKRNASFLEPHIQGVRRRDSRSSDSDHDERSTEDDERSLLRSSPPTRLPPPPPPPPDDEPPPLRPREFFERLQSQAMREAQERKQRPIRDSSRNVFRSVDTDGSLGDSLSQSRESLSSDGEGAKGDCSSVGSSGSGYEEQPLCDVGTLERLIRTHPVWFLPGIQRAGAFHLLQGKEEGNFVVRQSSQADTMAISVRLPADKGPYIEHYLIQATDGRIGLETSHNRFDNIPELIAHYSQCCDELPVQLQLPRPLREAKSRHQLSSLALLGQEFWGYPMANPRNNPQNLLSPTQLTNGIVPMAVTPSDTGSSLSSFNASTTGTISQQILSPEKDNVVLKMSPIDMSGSPPSQNQNLSTFKGRTAPSPPAKPNGNFVRAPRPTPPNTLNLMSSTANITQPHTFPTTNTPHSPTQTNSVKMTPPPPPPRWAKPPFTKASSEQAFCPINKASQNGNITVTTTVTFSVNNTQIHNHQINENIQSDRLQLTLASNAINNNNNNANSVFNITDTAKSLDSSGDSQNMMHRLSPEGECINAITSLHGSFKRHMTENNAPDPSSPMDQQSLNTSESVDPVVNSFTKSSNSYAPNQLVSPNGTNSVTSGIFSPTSQINSPVSNDTISSKSGVFSPISQNKSELFSPLSRSSPVSGKNVFSPSSNQSIVSPLMGKDREKLLSPNTNTNSTTPSGRSRRSKHSLRKESRHYQESDILESPGVYYRSSLMDKVSDYEDIWGPENNSNNCSTFKPLRPENENNLNNGLMKSKRPDLLPDTLPKLNAAKSTQSILEKENLHILDSNESLNEKKNFSDCSSKKSFNGSHEIIATTNSKGEVVAKRPDKLNIGININKKLTEEIEATFRNKDNLNTESMETIKLEDDCVNVPIINDPEKDHAGSPFYADPVDAIKEAAQLPVQRRKLLRVGVSLAQRYSEPPTQNHPYYPLRDMHSIEELSPSSPNTSTSVDNLVSLRSKPKIKPVQPPRVTNRPPPGKDTTWTVDSSWEFINKNDEGSNSESGTFPSLVEQETRLSGVDDGAQHLTVHQIVAQRLPELKLNPEPAALPEEVRSPPRASCYDNVHDLRPLSEQASDDGTVFSEPWDSSQWDGLLPPNGNQPYDAEEPCEWESPLPRRGPAVATRAKSFRDRLDPLLAASRVRALRGSRAVRGGGAGAALRAYALHLAQDKSTTFAQNVDNFIACTLDSKEICPQIVMRNIRQFMSGMKNYLVKHGEREFEKEVEKERLKLKPTEFLNIDAILEGVMHRLVVRPLRARLYSLLASWHASDVRQLHAAIEKAQHATPLQLGVKESTKVPSSAVLAVISKHFLKMQEADSPLDKLENLLAAISVIFNSIRGERSLGADDLLPVLAWTVARCRLVCAELEAELMAGLLPAALLAGEGGYYLTALFSAVAVLKRLAPDPAPDSTAPWRRGSLESGSSSGACAVVRVALPDECRGSIRRVALPCRPGARARDLCRALAHAAAITNPQDYALFALHDGQETMLNENDCPHEVMSEKSGQNFILAYKRIDAKIAWPQQALLSLP